MLQDPLNRMDGSECAWWERGDWYGKNECIGRDEQEGEE